ncbi:hypothetical protein [Devosia sp.]|uniref:hypothetical protein n=1 Tax=Devosia sp. TaxID=1871048 RepID=UPI00292D65F5|nr:hypothetical protein [Devosia sp.]
MNNDSETQPAPSDAYFGLLDAIVVLAEAWKMLAIACILAVLAGFGYFQLQPKIYQSNAIVSLDAAQLALFSAPDFLERTGVDSAMWNLDLTHAEPALEPTQPYSVSFRAESPQAAQAGLDAVIKAFMAEVAPDATGTEILQRSRERIIKALENLELISTKLAQEADGTLPGAESELYARSVVLLLDEQAKREAELLDVESKLAGSGGIVVSAPSLPTAPIPQSLRAVMVASVGGAIFLVLCFAFGREAVRRAARTASGAEKLRRLSRAFSFGRRA